MMVGPMRPKPSELAMGGASARAISSHTSPCFKSFGTLETSHARSSWQNDNSSVVKFRPIKKAPPRYRSRTPTPFLPNVNQLSANQAGSAAAPRRGKIRANRIPALPIFLAKRSEEHTSELQSPDHLVCRLLLEKKKNSINTQIDISPTTMPLTTTPTLHSPT